jgi:hypothetical protein
MEMLTDAENGEIALSRENGWWMHHARRLARLQHKSREVSGGAAIIDPVWGLGGLLGSNAGPGVLNLLSLPRCCYDSSHPPSSTPCLYMNNSIVLCRYVW